jgi:hypothetical protein
MAKFSGMESQERARLQTTDEWLEEYETGVPVIPAALSPMPASQSILTKKEILILGPLVFDSHRTTKEGSVVLSFIDPETSEEYVAFFNVDIRIQRGDDKGKSYRSGQGGQFLPKKRSKFRKFWHKVVGKEPRRWASVYKEFKKGFRGKLFTGEAERCLDKNREPYSKLINPRKLTEQERINYVTEEEQLGNSFWEQEIPW